jgi:DNA polymerase III delta subunit
MTASTTKRPSRSPGAQPANAGYQAFRQQFAGTLRELGGGEGASSWPALMVLTGDSDFFIGKALQALRDTWKKQNPAAARVNDDATDDSTDDSTDEAGAPVVNSVDATELSKDGLLDLVLSQSLFEDTQLVIVRRAEKRSEFGKLLAMLPDPDRWSNRMVVAFEKPALTAELQRQVTRLNGQLVQVAQPLTQADFLQFTQAAAQRARLQLTAEAQHLILNCCGRDAIVIENEINRLGLLFPPADGPVGRPSDLGTAEVAGVLGVLREDEVFRLDELLVNRRHAEVEILLYNLLDRGESVLAITGVLARHCRNALAIQDEMARRGALDMPGMAARLRLPQAVIRNFVRYVPSVPRTTFERALASCARADVELKTSGLPDGLALSRIVECFQTH